MVFVTYRSRSIPWTKDPAFNQYVNLLVQMINDNRRIYVCFTTKIECEIVSKALQMQCATKKDKLLLITADIADTERAKLHNIDDYFKDYQAVLTTSVLCRGTDCQLYFDYFIGIANSTPIIPSDFLQMIHRVRHYTQDRGFLLLPRPPFQNSRLPEDINHLEKMSYERIVKNFPFLQDHKGGVKSETLNRLRSDDEMLPNTTFHPGPPTIRAKPQSFF